MEIVEGNLIDIESREFYPCAISISKGKIINIERNNNSYDQYISPGFIDAHVHVESSMLMPAEFSKLVIPNGTVGVIADPHEIANVLGVEGVELMISNGEKAPLKFFWGIPSCVPATSFDKPGAVFCWIFNECFPYKKLDNILKLCCASDRKGLLSVNRRQQVLSFCLDRVVSILYRFKPS